MPKPQKIKIVRPRTSYNFFFHQERKKIQDEVLSKTGKRPRYTDLSRFVAARWQKADPQEKAHFQAMAANDKRRYALDKIKLVTEEDQERIQGFESEEPIPIVAARNEGAPSTANREFVTNPDCTIPETSTGSEGMSDFAMTAPIAQQYQVDEAQAQMAEVLRHPGVAEYLASLLLPMIQSPTGIMQSFGSDRGRDGYVFGSEDPAPYDAMAHHQEDGMNLAQDEDAVNLLEDIFGIGPA